MASSGNDVRVPIGIPVETNASQAASSVEELRASLAKSRDAIKDVSTNLRALRGNSDEVKAAKDQLKAILDKERAAMSDGTLQILKQEAAMKASASGAEALAKSNTKLATASKTAAKEQEALNKKKNEDPGKKAEERSKALGDAIARTHPRIAQLRDGLKQLGETASKGGDLGVVVAALGLVAAAAIAATVAVGGLVVAFGGWILKSADAARSMSLIRQGSTRTAVDAKNLGDHIDQLALKVPTSTAALNDLGASLARSRLGGQVTVDTLNAVAQANAGIGDQAGAKLREIVERGRLVNRMFLGWQELQGTGIDYDDIAGALADSMHVSVAKARQALMTGAVTLGQGAAAMRAAVEKKLGGINAEKLLSLDGIKETLGKLTTQMTRDIDLKPAARGAAEFLKAFDQSTATGQTMKRLVTEFGNGMVKAFEKGGPLAAKFLRELIIGTVKAEVAYLEFRVALSDAINVIEKPLKATGILDALDKIIPKGKTASFIFGEMTGFLTLAEAAFHGAAKMLELFTNGLEKVEVAFAKIQKAATTGVGGAIVDGIIGGMKDGEGKLANGSKSLADIVKKTLKGDLEIHSPSMFMRRDVGRQLPRGVGLGIEDETNKVTSALEDMVPKTPRYAELAAKGGAGASSGGSPTVIAHLHVHMPPGASPGDVASSPETGKGFLDALKEAAAAGGFTVAAA